MESSSSSSPASTKIHRSAHVWHRHALVSLIVTAADGCCCASNGRAVFALFCPKKHGRRKSGKAKQEAHLEADGLRVRLPSRCFRKHRNGDKTHKLERWFGSDNATSPSEDPSNGSFLPAHKRWLETHNLDTWWGRFPPSAVIGRRHAGLSVNLN